MMETAVSKRAIGVITGLETTTSYVDQFMTFNDKYVIEGTTYSYENGRLVCQDYSFETKVNRTPDGKIRYNTTFLHLPDLIAYATNSSTVTAESVPIGKSRYSYY